MITLILSVLKAFWIFLIGNIPLVSALVTIITSLVVFRLTNRENKKENYLRHMIKSYYEIEDGRTRMIELNNLAKDSQHADFNLQKETCMREIKVNSTIMRYYLDRFPGYYNNRTEFGNILIDITHHPDEAGPYAKLSEIFQDFLWSIRDKKEKSHTYYLDDDGYPTKA